MTPNGRQHEIERLFAQTAELNADQREAFLTRACAGLPGDIRAEVEQLLAADMKATAGRFLDAVPFNIADAVGLIPETEASEALHSTDARDTSTPLVVNPPPGDVSPNKSSGRSIDNDTGRAEDESLSPSGSQSATFPRAFATGRYATKRILGEGGQKQVYLATDTRLGRDVVVATVRHDVVDASELDRIRREARTLAKLTDHPHIVSVFDVGEDNGQPFIVTQFVEGGSVRDLIKQHRPSPLAVEQAVRLAQQTCQALDHAHKQAIIHRDGKPANIWLTRDGTAKVGDFGIASVLDQSRLTATGAAVGTALYVSPEQALGGSVSPTSDLYSLGVVLYEMLTGRPPFEGDNVLALISQHLDAVPVPPSWKNSDVDDALDSLVLQLLSKRPEERPPGAMTVQETLHAIAARLSPPREKGTRRLGCRPLNRLGHGVFVGRRKELQQLRESLEQAIAGGGQVIMLTGEPGSGKTRTAEELVTYARLRGVEVHRGHCHEEHAAPAFWPWIHVIRSCAQHREPHRLAEIMGSGAVDIASLDGQIAERLPVAPNPHHNNSQEARFRLFDAVTTFLGNACKENPCLVVLDNLHWADEPSLRLLSYLASEVNDKHLMVLGTFRDVSLDSRHPLMRTLGELANKTLQHRIDLPGLSEDDVGEFITSILGADGLPYLVSCHRIELHPAECTWAEHPKQTNLQHRVVRSIRQPTIGLALGRMLLKNWTNLFHCRHQEFGAARVRLVHDTLRCAHTRGADWLAQLGRCLGRAPLRPALIQIIRPSVGNPAMHTRRR